VAPGEGRQSDSERAYAYCGSHRATGPNMPPLDQVARVCAKPRSLTSRKFQPGSRRVVVLSLLKQPDVQINYGTGKDVSDETIADAREPLRVEWFTDSFIDVPARR